MMSRKKRRGIIEKRRRDRINTSLSELRRLVPTAYEKQGSAKLEKAEILQMTVDHLKMLHSKGLDALAYDPSKFAMDYHNIGFRECAAEVARYLVSVEGLDIQDPLRLRLMSHLQCFATQREFASKQPTSAWYPSTNAAPGGAIPTMPGPAPNINPSHNYHQSGSSLSPIANSHSHHSHISAPPPPPPPPPPIIHPPSILPIGAGSIGGPTGLQHHNNSSLNSSSSSSGSSLNSSNNNSHSLNNSYENGTANLESTPSSSSSGNNGQQMSAAASSTSTLTPLTTVSSISANDGYHQNYHQHHQHHSSMELSPYATAHHHLAGIHQHHNMHLQQQTHHHPYSQPGNDPSGVSSQMKPYRPWGAELAY